MILDNAKIAQKTITWDLKLHFLTKWPWGHPRPCPVKFHEPRCNAFWDMTDRLQTEYDAYAPIVQVAQVGSKMTIDSLIIDGFSIRNDRWTAKNSPMQPYYQTWPYSCTRHSYEGQYCTSTKCVIATVSFASEINQPKIKVLELQLSVSSLHNYVTHR